jgi:hypothetical protein
VLPSNARLVKIGTHPARTAPRRTCAKTFFDVLVLEGRNVMPESRPPGARYCIARGRAPILRPRTRPLFQGVDGEFRHREILLVIGDEREAVLQRGGGNYGVG